MLKQKYLFIPAAVTALMLLTGCSSDDHKENKTSAEEIATLLGTDSNNNGVRDDVEAKIMQKFKRPVEQALMMQYASDSQEILKDPVAAAKSEALDQKLFNAEACEGYLMDQYNLNLDKDYGDPLQYLDGITYNTKERIEAYMKYNQGKSGGSYSVANPWKDFIESACDFNVTEMIELEK